MEEITDFFFLFPSHYHNTLEGFITERSMGWKLLHSCTRGCFYIYSSATAFLFSTILLQCSFSNCWLPLSRVHLFLQRVELLKTTKLVLTIEDGLCAWYYSPNNKSHIQSALTFRLQFCLFVPRFDMICSCCNGFWDFPVGPASKHVSLILLEIYYSLILESFC